MVVPSFHKIKTSEKVVHKIFDVPFNHGFLENEMLQLEIEGHKHRLLFKMSEVQTVICESFINNTKFLEELKSFDLIIHDSLAFCPATMLYELLGIPKVEILPLPPNAPLFNHMIPMPVSYVPQIVTGFSDKMTFIERVVNLVAYLGGQLFVYIAYNRPMNALKVKYNIKPEKSFQKAAGETELVIITSDFALEYAQPLLPGECRNGGPGYLTRFVLPFVIKTDNRDKLAISETIRKKL